MTSAKNFALKILIFKPIEFLLDNTRINMYYNSYDYSITFY